MLLPSYFVGVAVLFGVLWLSCFLDTADFGLFELVVNVEFLLR